MKAWPLRRSSWQVRIENLSQVVWPTLRRDFNWVLGVRPDTSIDTQATLGRDTFIESGFLWLLWAGGLMLLAAFVVLVVVAFGRFRAAARAVDPWLSAAGGAGLASTTFVLILMTIDPHITLRGFADVYFGLLAISLVAAAAPARPPLPGWMFRLTPPDLGWFRYSYVTSGSTRLLDVIVSSILLVVLSPLLLSIAFIIRRTSPGPALFRQTRVGFAERPFTILKFRTMRTDTDDDEHREFVRSMLRDTHPRSNDPVPGDPYKLTDDPGT